MKKTALLLALTLMLSLGVSCSKNKDKSESESSSATSTTTSASDSSSISQSESQSQSQADKVENTTRNPLTGQTDYNEDAIGKRPVAVMINNLKGALPQYGIEQADILFEVLVEGGITRLMGVYADYTAVPDVCSVRSCRYYYPVIAMGFDAVYCHIGYEQTFAKAKLNSLGIDTISDSSVIPYSTMFAVDSERAQSYSSEHTKYLVGANIPQALEDYGYRTDLGDEYKGDYFVFEDEFFSPEGAEASNVNLKFSASYYSTFEYDESTKTYKKFHNGSEHIDGKSGNQLSYTNVIVLCTEVYPKPENTYLMEVEMVSSGTGYYISGGKAQEITWEKTSEEAQIDFFGPDGNPLTVNVGKCYIGVIDNNATITIE
ncbi:MAG: DUF3048 domain-containing protein [Oscillospiraceae bacterium]|nr:DUF3048 domain-containing protein [Oscillospiraceae bacterium]